MLLTFCTTDVAVELVILQEYNEKVELVIRVSRTLQESDAGDKFESSKRINVATHTNTPERKLKIIRNQSNRNIVCFQVVVLVTLSHS